MRARTMGESVISYERQTTSSPNPLARLAHHTRTDRSRELVCSYLSSSGAYLDFGAGTGKLLSEIRQARPDASLIGIEPYMANQYPGDSLFLKAMSEVESSSIDVVSAFEVCEHLKDEELDDFLHASRRVLRKSGKLILSVPIMYGAAAVAKYANQRIFRGPSDYRPLEVLRSAVGLPVGRSVARLGSHKGFDFRRLESILNEGFVTEHRSMSPLTSLPWYVNSQVFYICAPRGLS